MNDYFDSVKYGEVTIQHEMPEDLWKVRMNGVCYASSRDKKTAVEWGRELWMDELKSRVEDADYGYPPIIYKNGRPVDVG